MLQLALEALRANNQHRQLQMEQAMHYRATRVRCISLLSLHVLNYIGLRSGQAVLLLATCGSSGGARCGWAQALAETVSETPLLSIRQCNERQLRVPQDSEWLRT